MYCRFLLFRFFKFLLSAIKESIYQILTSDILKWVLKAVFRFGLWRNSYPIQQSFWWESISRLNLTTDCHSCWQQLPLSIKLATSVVKTLLCRIILIQPHWRVFKNEWPFLVMSQHLDGIYVRTLTRLIQNLGFLLLNLLDKHLLVSLSSSILSLKSAWA